MRQDTTKTKMGLRTFLQFI